jgi:hypothetical protein
MPTPAAAVTRHRDPEISALLVAAVLLAGCGGDRVNRAEAPDRAEAPADILDCSAPETVVSAPSAGAVLHPGPFFAAGLLSGTADEVAWQVRDAAGTVLDEGAVDVVRTDVDATWAVPLELPEGGYRLEVWPGDGPSSTSQCPGARTEFTVDPGATGPSWVSGASGPDIPTGAFGRWRGHDAAIAGTWADRDGGQLELWPLVPGGSLAEWDADLEIALGALERGETWAAAAQGAYDDRWRESLRRLAQLWAGRSGQLYIRFAHEFNGTWFPWSVTPTSRADFVAAWQRYRALQRELFPDAALVFAPNSETTADGLDWRAAFPGTEYVDVLSVSYFNAYPWTDTVEDFRDVALRYDDVGAPRGIQRHLEFARSVGVPFAVSEWGNNAMFGDSPTFMQQMDQLFRANAGTGAGQLRYEILFNVVHEDNPFAVMPETNAPEAAEAYRRLW